MSSTSTRRARSRAVALSLVALAATSASASGAGIVLNRLPAPPQAVKIGAGVQTVAFTVTYDTKGTRVLTRIKKTNPDLSEVVIATLEDRALNDAAPQTGRTVSGTLSWNVPGSLAPGTYQVETRFYSTAGGAVSPETQAAASFDVAAELGELQSTVFEDTNGNGVRDPGEAGLEGWRFIITSPNGGESELVTPAGGTAAVPSVPAGNWQVFQTPTLPGWTPTTPTSGSVAVPADGVGGLVVGVVRPVAISGTVFDDRNRDGLQQGSESGLGGATVTLTGTTGKGVPITPISKPTAPDGSYSFTGLPPGTYTVVATPLPGTTATTGTTRAGLTVPSGITRDHIDFGLAPGGTLQVGSFEDTNGNGVRDPGEPGIPACPFGLASPTGDQASITTGADGAAVRPDSVFGTWQVGQGPCTGFIPTTATSGPVVVPPGGTGSFNVGNVRPATVSGLVFIDANRNGRRDGGEAINPGVVVRLTGTDGRGRPVSLETVTGTDGRYTFGGLQPGNYRVTVVTPSGVELTTPGSVSDIVVVSGGARRDVDFGVATPVPPTTITPTPTPTPAKTLAGASPGALRVIKTGPPTARAGGVFTYVITVRSIGTVTAKNVVLTDAVPSLMTLAAPPSGARVVNGVVTWLLGDLAPGRERRVLLRVRLAAGAPVGRYANTATAGGDNVPLARATSGLRLQKPAKPRRTTGGVTG